MLYTKNCKRLIVSAILAASLMIPASQHCIDKDDVIRAGGSIVGVTCFTGLCYIMYASYNTGKKVAELTESERALLLVKTALEETNKELIKDAEDKQKQIEALQNEIDKLKKSVIADQSKKMQLSSVVENSSTHGLTDDEQRFAHAKKKSFIEQIPDFFKHLD